MTVFFYCLCGKRKQQAKELEGQGFRIIVTKNNPTAMKEAKSYGLRLPIKVIDGKAERI